MSKNRTLNKASIEKNDEFYTRLEDIEKECRHYKKFFHNKTILCNCDDPYESMFFQYFAMKFNSLGLKKLISSSYAGSLIVQSELNFECTSNEIENFDRKKDGLKAKMTEFKDWNGDHNGAIQKLYGDENFSAGDFRSPECIELLKQADIVVTNPPFSLFREYVQQLIDFDKKFLIIGNINCITYKEIFKLIMQNKIWLGYGMGRAIAGFIVPEKYELYGTEARIENGKRIISTNQCMWLTNLDITKRHEEIPLVFSYKDEPEKYPKYDNYDAIEVSKTAYIPKDYDGVMGVPITFLDKYNPEQFEILGCSYSYGDCGKHIDGTSWGCKIKGKDIYKRLFIRRRITNED